MDVFEAVGFIVLCALSFRIVISIVSGAVAVGQANDGETIRQQVSNALLWFGGFGEVAAIIFLLGLVAFLWWRVNDWSELFNELDGEPDPDAFRQASLSHLQMLRWQSRWAHWLLFITAIGTAINIVPPFINGIPIGLQWSEDITNTGFQVSYIAILVGGIILSDRLCATCDMAIREGDETPRVS
jgi:hypothetical protein